MKTIIFEKKFGVDIKDFKSMREIDDFIEGKTGRKLELSSVHSPLVSGHSVFPIRKYDIDKLFDEAIRK